jgi:hypothetical protein
VVAVASVSTDEPREKRPNRAKARLPRVDPATRVECEVADLFSWGARINRADHLAENAGGLVADRHFRVEARRGRRL